MAKLKDIAEKAGVSIRTVSRALNESGPVDETRKQTILKIAKELGYRPNRIARSLRTGKKHEITVIINNVDELTTEKLAGSERIFRKNGYTLNILFAADIIENRIQLEEITDEVLGRRPGGIMVFSRAGTDVPDMLEVLSESNLPCVLVDPPVKPEGIDTVMIDRQQGVYESVMFLADKGYKKIAYLGHRLATRLDGYNRAHEDLGREPVILPEYKEGTQFAGGRKAVNDCLEMEECPDAIQAYTDEYALGFLAGMYDQGLKAPDDFAVVGFDNRRESMLSSPPLTTVGQPTSEVGEQAAELLLSRIRGEEKEDAVVVKLPTKLVLRETV